MNNSKNFLPEVRKQYEHLPYPFRDPEDEKKRLIPLMLDDIAHINHYCFKGKCRLENERILVAGGGTGDAAIFLGHQLRNANSEIVYLDISRESMKIARERARIRGLKNIKWIHGSLLDIPKMGLGSFDYINCSGVLHHLADPMEGLAALRSALMESGAIGIMVYGRYGREPVRQIRRLLRRINRPGDNMDAKILRARTILASLPSTNWLVNDKHDWLNEVRTMGDAGLFDLFLHSRERSYSVPELYDWVESCGLRIVEFSGAGLEGKQGYDPGAYIKDKALLADISGLPRRERQASAELLSGALRKHCFYVARREDVIADLHDLDNIPFFCYSGLSGAQIAEWIDKIPGNEITINYEKVGSIVFSPNRYGQIIFKHLDGNRSLGVIFDRVRAELHASISNEELLADFNPAYEAFNSMDTLLLRDKAMPGFPQWH